MCRSLCRSCFTPYLFLSNTCKKVESRICSVSNTANSTSFYSFMPAKQGLYWIGTIPHHGFLPFLPPGCDFLRCQLERGTGDTAYLHWQLVVHLERKASLHALRKMFGPYHFELTRSKAALDYVFKDDTYVEPFRYEFGTLPLSRARSADWESIWRAASSGDITSIPADVRVRHYSTLRKIASDYTTAGVVEKEVFVFWGPTGTGKSHRAWNEAGLDAYPKDGRNKWWDGYQGQLHVVIDEFAGIISIDTMLKWLDKWPVLVEIKGAKVPLKCQKIWITSNIDPDNWYPDAIAEHKAALRRRIKVTHFNAPLM